MIAASGAKKVKSKGQGHMVMKKVTIVQLGLLVKYAAVAGMELHVDIVAHVLVLRKSCLI